MKRHLDKIGVGGSAFAALCCLGLPALLGFVSALGLGFLLRDAVLIPLLVAFLALALYGLYDGMRRHGRRGALWTGTGGALVLFASIWIGSGLIAGFGIAALVGASLHNVWLGARSSRPSDPARSQSAKAP